MIVNTENIEGLDFKYYIEAVLEQLDYLNSFRYPGIYGFTNSIDFTDDLYTKPLFDIKKYSELSPNLTDSHKQMLDSINTITNNKLIAIINSLIILNYKLIEDE